MSVAAPSGSWRPAARELRIRVRLEAEPRRVRLDGRDLPRLTTGGSPAASWWWGAGVVEVRLPDPQAAIQVDIDQT